MRTRAAYSRCHYLTKCQLPVTTISSRMDHHYHQPGSARKTLTAWQPGIKRRAPRDSRETASLFVLPLTRCLSSFGLAIAGRMYHKTTTRNRRIFFRSVPGTLRTLYRSRVPGIMLSEFNYNRSSLLGLLLRSILRVCVTLWARPCSFHPYMHAYTYHN